MALLGPDHELGARNRENILTRAHGVLNRDMVNSPIKCLRALGCLCLLAFASGPFAQTVTVRAGATVHLRAVGASLAPAPVGHYDAVDAGNLLRWFEFRIFSDRFEAPN